MTAVILEPEALIPFARSMRLVETIAARPVHLTDVSRVNDAFVPRIDIDFHLQNKGAEWRDELRCL